MILEAIREARRVKALQRNCFHHDRITGESWVVVRAVLHTVTYYGCTQCEQQWVI